VTENELRQFSRECYAALGAKAPESSSPAWRIWAEMCADVPLTAVPYIRGKLFELDSMPRNFGKAVKALAAEWRSDTRQPKPEQQCCHECYPPFPGFFPGWQKAEGGMLYKFMIRCLCNGNPYFDPMPRKSKAQAEREGYTVLPVGRRSAVEFEMETFYPERRGKGGLGQLPVRLARNPAPQESVRKAHAEQLEYYDYLAEAL